MALKRKIDFSNVKESSGINPTHVEAGDYLAKVVKVLDAPAKDETPMWCYILELKERKSATYPYYCKLQENQLWKLRNLLVAAGKTVPKKAVMVNAESVLGSVVGITLEDDEYEGKQKSVIAAIFPPSELEDEEDEGENAEESDDTEEDDEELDLDEL